MKTNSNTFPINPRRDQTKVFRVCDIGRDNVNEFVENAKKLDWHLTAISNVRVHFAFGKPAIEYTAMCGEHIKTATLNACKLAAEKNKNVFFNFNGKEIFVTPETNVEDVLRQREIDSIKEREEYEKSDEYKKTQRANALELAAKQIRINLLLKSLYDNKITTLNGLMLWLKKFTNLADFGGLDYNEVALIEWFEKNGYVENYGVGYPKEFFDTRNNMGRYIIGQAISCLRIGMGPHPITIDFVDKYFKLKT